MTEQNRIEQELNSKPFAFQQKVEACKVLYLKHGGRHHDHIQDEMRRLGNDRWNNRCLYARWRGTKRYPGWPERFGWKSEPPAVAGGLTGRSKNLEKNRNRAKQRRSAKLKLKQTNIQPPATAGGSDFRSWLKRLPGNYNWDWKFQRYVIERLEAFERGDTTRLMLFVPPRHGKSELVTVRFTAWHLTNNPHSNVIVGSYNQRLADRFSRRIRNVYAEALQSGPPAAAGGLTPGTTTLPPAHNPATCAICIRKAAECPHAGKAGNAALPGCTAGSPGVSEANKTGHTGDNAAAREGACVPAIKSRRIQTDAEWETHAGGGVRAVGCGSGITGFGANLIIIDDPVKSRSEAESQTIRDKAYDWFNDDIYTRLEPGGKIILIQTRWHEDDLAGRLLREMEEDETAEPWDVINFPAIAESEPPASAGGRSADPDRCASEGNIALRPFPNGLFDTTPTLGANADGSVKKPIYIIRNGHRELVRTLGEPEKNSSRNLSFQGPEKQSFSADRAAQPQEAISDPDSPNSQNSPDSSPSGLTPIDVLGRLPGEALCPERYPIKSLLQRKKRLGTYSWNALYQQRPIPAEGGFFKRHWFKIIDHIPPGLRWKRGYDLGISASPGADYTATARVARDADGNLYIDRVLRRRMEYPEQRRAILALIATETDTEHFIEKTANGTAVIQDLRREAGIAERHFCGVEVRESKTARAFTWNALAEEGRVHLIRGAWNKDFIDEACSFPSGAHDDQIDAVSIAVKMLRETKSKKLHCF